MLTEEPLSSVTNSQSNYGASAYRKVSSCAPTLKFFYGPSPFSPRDKFKPKITIFGNFGAVKPQW